MAMDNGPERKLATVRSVSAIKPIDGADNIQLAQIDGWEVVIRKGEYQAGDPVIYVEIGSFLPVRPEYEFLRRSSFKKDAQGKEGFTVKSVMFRGVLSQGLVLPVPPEFSGKPIGTDLSTELGITQFFPKVVETYTGRGTLGSIIGEFDDRLLHRTDEERVQNASEEDYTLWQSLPLYVTEKIDGSSVTFLWESEHKKLRMFSRNKELADDGMVGEVARSLGLRETLLEHDLDIAIQGELCGPKTQANPYKLTRPRFFAFNVIEFPGGRVGLEAFKFYCMQFGIETVPILGEDFKLPDNRKDLIKFADGTSVLNKEVAREGIVVRSHTSRVSFKVVSNAWLLKKS